MMLRATQNAAPARKGNDTMPAKNSRQIVKDQTPRYCDDAILLSAAANIPADVARDVLDITGGLQALANADIPTLQHRAQISEQAAAGIMAAIEVGRRTLTTAPATRPVMSSPRAVASFLLPRFGAGCVESFGILMLDSKNRPIAGQPVAIISRGALDATLADPREVFRNAVIRSAARIVIFHNHPSGDPTPSHEDASVTTRMQQAGAMIGIEVLDHMVLGATSYYSFQEAGRI